MIRETSNQDTNSQSVFFDPKLTQGVPEKPASETKIKTLAKNALPDLSGEATGCFVFTAKPLSETASKKKSDDVSEKKRTLKTHDALLQKKLTKKTEKEAVTSSGAKNLEEERLSSLPDEKAATEASQLEKTVSAEAAASLPSGNKRLLENASTVQASKQSKQVDKASLFSTVAQCRDEFEALAHKIEDKVSPTLSFVKRSCLFFYLKCTFFPALKEANDYQGLYGLLDEIRSYIKNPAKLAGVESALREDVVGLLDAFADRIPKKTTLG